jgi:hypothetical protein
MGKDDDDRFKKTLYDLIDEGFVFGPPTAEGREIEREVRGLYRQMFVDPYLQLFTPASLGDIDRILGDYPGSTTCNIPSTRDRLAQEIGSYKSHCRSDRPSRAAILKLHERIRSNAQKLRSDLRKISISSYVPDPLDRDQTERATQEYEFNVNLGLICAWADEAVPAQKRINARSGREPDWAWNDLMWSLAHMYRHGPANCEPKVLPNHNRSADCDEDYTGDFFKIAKLVEEAAARAISEKPLDASALGPRLMRLLESRRRRDSVLEPRPPKSKTL